MFYNSSWSIPYYEMYSGMAPRYVSTHNNGSSSNYTVCYHNGVPYSPGSTVCIGGINKLCTSEGTWENAGTGSCLAEQPNLVSFSSSANPCQGMSNQPSFPPKRPDAQVITADELKKCKGYWTYLWTNLAQGWILIKDITDNYVYGCVWVLINGKWYPQYRYVPINEIENYYYIIQ